MVSVGVLSYIAIRGEGPGWRAVVGIVAIGGLLVCGIRIACRMPRSTLLGAGSDLVWDMAQSFVPMLPLVLLTWYGYRVLRRAPDDFGSSDIRRAAVGSLVIGTCLFFYSTMLMAMSHLTEQRPRIPMEREYLALCTVTAANLLAAVPWIKLDRRRVAWLKGRPYSLMDSGSRWLLVVSLLCVGVGNAMANYILSQPYSHRPLFWPLALAFYYFLPQLAGSGLFLVAMMIQLYRDRWHRILASAACLYFVPYWLIFVWNPRVLLMWE